MSESIWKMLFSKEGFQLNIPTPIRNKGKYSKSKYMHISVPCVYILHVICSVIIIAYLITIANNHYSIELIGNKLITVECGEEFKDLGAIGYNKDKRIKVLHTGKVDTNTPGEYTIIYCTGKLFNTVCTTRIVQVIDTTLPTIELLEKEDYIPPSIDEYKEEGFIATDNVDGDITSQVIQERNGNTITYTVSDSSGNTVSVTRTVKVRSDVYPVITLNGGNNVYLPLGSEYQELGYQCLDKKDGDITSLVAISNNIDLTKEGEYQVTYTIVDSDQNEDTQIRNVIVTKEDIPKGAVNLDKVIFLTFDDGPCENTEKLLDILDQYNVKATFFVTAQFSSYLDMLPTIQEKGHTLALHSMSHEYETIYSSTTNYYQDLNQINDILESYIGYRSNILRFPGGSSNGISKNYRVGIMTSLTKTVVERGYQYFDWNISSEDCDGADTVEEVYQNVISQIKATHGFNTVLQHDTKEYSVNAVSKIIEWGQENGYTFLQLYYSTTPLHHHLNN